MPERKEEKSKRKGGGQWKEYSFTVVLKNKLSEFFFFKSTSSGQLQFSPIQFQGAISSHLSHFKFFTIHCKINFKGLGPNPFQRIIFNSFLIHSKSATVTSPFSIVNVSGCCSQGRAHGSQPSIQLLLYVVVRIALPYACSMKNFAGDCRADRIVNYRVARFSQLNYSMCAKILYISRKSVCAAAFPDTLQRLRKGKEDYGMNNVHTSHAHVKHFSIF